MTIPLTPDEQTALSAVVTTPNLDAPAPFRAWLLTLPETMIVGRSGFAESCPLQAWLMAQGAERAVVDCFEYSVRLDGHWTERRDLPPWVLGVRRQIDRPFGHYRAAGEPVSPAECLAALDYVLEVMERRAAA